MSFVFLNPIVTCLSARLGTNDLGNFASSFDDYETSARCQCCSRFLLLRHFRVPPEMGVGVPRRYGDVAIFVVITGPENEPQPLSVLGTHEFF